MIEFKVQRTVYAYGAHEKRWDASERTMVTSQSDCAGIDHHRNSSFRLVFSHRSPRCSSSCMHLRIDTVRTERLHCADDGIHAEYIESRDQ